MKGKAAPEILYSDDRVLYPMRRTNPKTEPEPVWERITWDEALNEIASKLNTIKAEHGAEAIAVGVTTPSGTPFSDAFDWAHRFQYALGTPNNVSGTEVCNWHKDTAHAFTVGSSILYPDYNNADTIVLWGFNPSAVWLDQATQVAEARARGATIIAVDPRDAGYARDANHWLRVRPGMDGTLIMGIANIVISQGGYDDEFLTQWSNGPFLVSGSSGLFLRSRDLTDGEGDDYIALSRSLYAGTDCAGDRY
jgi:anaerobic selenocysteine-containing dehydrogenase